MSGTIRISELSSKSALDNTDEFILEDTNGVNKKVTPEEIADYTKDSFTDAEKAAIDSGITSEKVALIDEGTSLVPDMTESEYDELPDDEKNNGQIRHITDAPETPVPFAVVNDNIVTSANVLSASRTATLNTELVTTNADATKTIPTFYEVNGTSVKVLFVYGHSGNSFTINGKKVCANKDGTPTEMTSHAIDSVDWFVQPYTTLELVYLSNLDSNAGGWLVMGNPIVLSGSSATVSYEVKANGFIKQWGSGTTSSGVLDLTFSLSFSNTNYYKAAIMGYANSPTYIGFKTSLVTTSSIRFGGQDASNYSISWECSGY